MPTLRVVDTCSGRALPVERFEFDLDGDRVIHLRLEPGPNRSAKGPLEQTPSGWKFRFTCARPRNRCTPDVTASSDRLEQVVAELHAHGASHIDLTELAARLSKQ